MQTNTTYKLYGKGTGSKNSHGDWVTTDTYIKDILVDKQPYNSELLLKTYGYKLDVTNRLFYPFFGVDSDIKEKCLLKILNDDGTDKEIYEIRKSIIWDTYTDIFVQKIK